MTDTGNCGVTAPLIKNPFENPPKFSSGSPELDVMAVMTLLLFSVKEISALLSDEPQILLPVDTGSMF